MCHVVTDERGVPTHPDLIHTVHVGAARVACYIITLGHLFQVPQL